MAQMACLASFGLVLIIATCSVMYYVELTIKTIVSI